MNARKSYVPGLLILLSAAGYLLLGYGPERSQFGLFFAVYAALFGFYFQMVRQPPGTPVSTRRLTALLAAAVLFRLLLVPAVPTLSDDIYRFIWDGNLWVHGLNPFAYTPAFLVQQGLPAYLPQELYRQLNSPEYYTVYPAVSQYLYGLSAAVAGTDPAANARFMKLVMVAFEVGTIAVLRRLLILHGLRPHWVLLYALNPLIILELAGSLHAEGMMIFFLLLAYYLFLKQRSMAAAGCFLMAVNTKLVPLLLLPYLVFSLGWRRASALIVVLAGGTLLLHLPFIDAVFLSHFGESLALYFRSFEFNASLYYVVRWIGFQMKGYNIIATAAPALALAGGLLIMGLSWQRRQASLENAPRVFLMIFGLYYLFATTVHPWYVAPLVAMAPLAGWYYPLAWSALVPLTYITYRTPAYEEHMGLVALEYLLVAAVVWYDYRRRSQPAGARWRRLLEGYLRS